MIWGVPTLAVMGVRAALTGGQGLVHALVPVHVVAYSRKGGAHRVAVDLATYTQRGERGHEVTWLTAYVT